MSVPAAPPQLPPSAGAVALAYAPYILVAGGIGVAGWWAYSTISGRTMGGALGSSTAGFATEFIKEAAGQLPSLAGSLTTGVIDSFAAIGKAIDPEGKVGQFVEDLGDASYPRGVGVVPSLNTCPKGWRTDPLTCFNTKTWAIKGRLEGGGKCSGGQENDAGLCYTKCKKGFHGVGPVCWIDKFGSHQAQSLGVRAVSTAQDVQRSGAQRQ